VDTRSTSEWSRNVSLACPSCGRSISIKDAKPGRFRIPCPECDRPFVLEVGTGSAPTLSARPVEPEGEPTVELPVTPGPWIDARQLASKVSAAVAERLGWAVRAITHRRSMVGSTLILEELGRTSRGLVARGRRVLQGRDVLVRTLPADWDGSDPVSRARAYRLAHAAGEIVHPNLVRRIDFGEDRGRRYAIEEALERPALVAIGRIGEPPSDEAAIALILHAARGLQAAHDQGLAHGNPSAENIWVDAEGVVKLTGLGLAPAGLESRDGPEPFSQAASRDVHGLGLTLATLIAERKGRALEIAARLKSAGTGEGYGDLGQAIPAMEEALGVISGGTFLPRDDEATRLSQAVAGYHDVPLAPLRLKLILGFLAVTMGFAILFARAGNFGLAGGAFGLAILTAIIYSLVRAGLNRRAGLLGRARELVLGGGRADWLTLAAVVAVVVGVLFLMGWLAGWIGLGIVAAIFAVGFLVAVDAPIDRDREWPLEEARALLAEMRGRGVSEVSLREFVSRYGGDRWEEPFEALFGLEELRRARLLRARDRPARFRLDAWRFPVFDWLETRLRDRREARARERFERLEEAALIAQKVNDMTARRRSRRIAEALIAVGREVREVSLKALSPHAGDGSIRVIPRPIPDLLREAVETPDRLLTSTWSDEREKTEPGPHPRLRLLAALTGPRARFVLGMLLLGAFLLWADQVGIISSREIRDRAQQAIADRDVGQIQAVNVDLDRAQVAEEPLVLPRVPPALTRFVSGYGVGVAGLILLISALASGSRIAFFALPAAAIAWFGPRLGIPPIAGLPSPAVAAAVGVGLLSLGIVFGRRA
jgi:MFS family permease